QSGKQSLPPDPLLPPPLPLLPVPVPVAPLNRPAAAPLLPPVPHASGAPPASTRAVTSFAFQAMRMRRNLGDDGTRGAALRREETSRFIEGRKIPRDILSRAERPRDMEGPVDAADRLLAVTEDAGAPLDARVAAGEELARLGDPRAN